MGFWNAVTHAALCTFYFELNIHWQDTALRGAAALLAHAQIAGITLEEAARDAVQAARALEDGTYRPIGVDISGVASSTAPATGTAAACGTSTATNNDTGAVDTGAASGEPTLKKQRTD
jgi:hypothetical protein